MHAGRDSHAMRAKVLAALALAAALAFAGVPALSAAPVEGQLDRGPETVEIDVSTRSIPIEADFSGTRIVIFGAIHNSRQEAAESGYYDIAVVVWGPSETLVARQKSRVAFIWVNTRSLSVEDVPAYYAFISTRPIEEIADKALLAKYRIGFDNVPMRIEEGGGGFSAEEQAAFRQAVIRQKIKANLYREADYGLSFSGPSLFRATLDVPANVPVGEFKVQAFLFHQGTLLSSTTRKLVIEKQGAERLVYALAYDHPFIYGVVAVLAAILAGLIASAIFKKD